MRLLPRSLAARTALVLLCGLVVVQAAGLAIYALDRLDFARVNVERESGVLVGEIYRAVADALPQDRDTELGRLRLPNGVHAVLGAQPVLGKLRPLLGPMQRALRHRLLVLPMPARLRPAEVIIANDATRHPPLDEAGFTFRPGLPPNGAVERGTLPAERFPRSPDVEPPPGNAPWRELHSIDGAAGRPASPPPFGPGPGSISGIPLRPPGTIAPPGSGWQNGLWGPLGNLTTLWDMITGRGRDYVVSMQLPDDGRWLSVRFVMPRPDPFLSPTLPAAFLVMTVAAGLLSTWAVRRLTAPLRILAVAAERLGRDVNSEPLPENGPTEVAVAAVAFNTMASRIRRFVTDRTLMLTAIGHDLRTPITRLKLRSEFIEDEELQAKFLLDLDELEAMVAATLAFGRDSSAREPLTPLDLGALLSTILDDAVDGRPDLDGSVGFALPPPAVTIQARPIALKRALTNLVNNAINYGGCARVTLRSPQDGHVELLVEDEGPGIPVSELERVFEPFVRVESSRNRETGGTGLGLSIARNIVRGLGGDIALANRSPHGLKATVTLVA